MDGKEAELKRRNNMKVQATTSSGIKTSFSSNARTEAQLADLITRWAEKRGITCDPTRSRSAYLRELIDEKHKQLTKAGK